MERVYCWGVRVGLFAMSTIYLPLAGFFDLHAAMAASLPSSIFTARQTKLLGNRSLMFCKLLL